MYAAKFRLVGLGLLSGAALAVGCSGNDGGGGNSSGGGGGSGSGNTTASTSPVTTTIGNAATSVNTATASQSTSSGSGTTSGPSTGTGSVSSTTGSTGATGSSTATASSTTGSATSATGSTASATSTSGTTASSTASTSGSATASTSGSTTASTSGSTTASTSSATTASTGSSTTASTSGSTTGSGGTGCDDPAPPVGSEGGAAGSDGGDWSGFNFVDESELDEWSILACGSGATNCVDEDAATVSFSCGVLQVEIDWPASANTQATRLQLQNVVPVGMLRDLTGKTLYARVRMTSPAVADHGYDFNVIAQDFIDDDDDSNDWKWFSTCYDGSGNCPENPSGETYTMGTWVPLALPMLADLAPDEFAFDSIRKLAFEIGTKYWAEGEPFSYDDAPATFEIDYVAW